MKEPPLILTFRQPIEDHVNQNVGSAPAGAVAAERRRSLFPNCSFVSAGETFEATLPSDGTLPEENMQKKKNKKTRTFAARVEASAGAHVWSRDVPGERGALSEARREQRLPDECTSGVEERLGGQGRLESPALPLLQR